MRYVSAFLKPYSNILLLYGFYCVCIIIYILTIWLYMFICFCEALILRITHDNTTSDSLYWLIINQREINDFVACNANCPCNALFLILTTLYIVLIVYTITLYAKGVQCYAMMKCSYSTTCHYLTMRRTQLLLWILILTIWFNWRDINQWHITQRITKGGSVLYL